MNMKVILAVLVTCIASWSWAQDFQETYKVSENSPQWVKYMYGDNVSLFVLREKFEDFYKVNEFEKNQHTQYFKRLMKEYWTQVDENAVSYTHLTLPTISDV